MFPIFHHPESIIVSIPCCQVHIQNIHILGMEVISSLIFESICISTVYLCDYRRSGAGLYHYSDEIYFRSFCLNRVNHG